MYMNKFEKRQTGFSLVEVLFAVMVLSMGLIFVAAQFPVGLMISKDAAEDMLNAVHAHNAHTMTELQMGSINTGYIRDSNGAFLNTHGGVNFFCRPNQRIDWEDIVMDDPGNDAFTIDPVRNYKYKQVLLGATPTFAKDEVPSHIIMETPDHTPEFISAQSLGNCFSPAIGRYDSIILDYLDAIKANDPPTALQLNNAFYNAIKTRRYAWCMLYQYRGTGNQDRTFCFYTFIVRMSNQSARYAVQDITITNPERDPRPYGPNQDRILPTPWYVDLYDDKVVHTTTDPVGTIDRFFINTASVLELLRAGSYIVDAGGTYPNGGHLYEVLEVRGNEVRLRTPLENDLQFFWVFPPAIEDRTYNPPRFAEQQPVMQVRQKVVRF